MKKMCGLSRLIVLSLLVLLASALPLAPADAAQVAVTVEKLTVDGGFIVEPQLLTLSGSETMAQATIRLLDSKFPGVKAYDYAGTINSSFYIESIYNPSTGSLLGEFHEGFYSGWMVTLNNYFIKASACEFTLTNRNVMRWQYTTGYGEDIGTDV